MTMSNSHHQRSDAPQQGAPGFGHRQLPIANSRPSIGWSANGVLTALFLAGWLAGLSACSHDDSSAPRHPDGRITIAVIPKGTTQVFWKSVHAGAVKAARELDVEVIWKGPLREDDRESQIKVVEDFITRGVDGVVLAPLDNVALRPAVNEAVRSRIPVVIIDSSIDTDRYVSFVATDSEEGGRRAGEHLARLLGEKGRVIVLRFLEGSASTEQRVQGFLDALKAYPDIEVASSNQRSGSTAELGYQASENLLVQFKQPDGRLSIDGIFCPNEFTTFSMLRALQDGQLAGKVRFVGFDSSDTLVAALAKGELDGLVLQDPINMGYLGVKTMVQHLRGERVETRIDTGSTVATRENMNEPEISGLLNPDFRKWLGED
jgi:ribose transport system substrate-binding protein